MSAPSPPKGIGRHGAALWRRVQSDYEMGPGEEELLEAAAIAWQRIHDAEAMVAEEGLLIDGARGRQAHPAIAVSRDASRLLAALLRQLRVELAEEDLIKHRRGGAGRPAASRRRRER